MKIADASVRTDGEAHHAKLTTLIEAHLKLECELVELVHELNDATRNALEESGIHGPNESTLAGLQPLTKRIQDLANRVRAGRDELAQRFDKGQDGVPNRMGSFIAQLGRDRANGIELRRRELLTKAQAAQSVLIENQACLFYNVQFHRNYLAGLIQQDSEGGNYNADGKCGAVRPGHLYRKSC